MAFAVHVPESVSDVVGALGEGNLLIAGGTAVMPRINTQALAVDGLVSLRRAGLAGIEVDAAIATVGAATTLAQVGAD
jgi:carbon-monoxide dehydrogenase medium subunit